jgi:O-methyltransferase
MNILDRLRARRRLRRRMQRADDVGDGLFVAGRNLAFLDDPQFRVGWAKAVEANHVGWRGRVPDVRWRAHVALFAARHGLRLEGDFVEFGVHTALLSTTICHALDFAQVAKSFYLFDTFAGIPLGGLDGEERERATTANTHYPDVFDVVRKNFAGFPNVSLVRGVLPDTLNTVSLGKIAYASIDLNTASVERAVIEAIWDRIVPGAMIVLDDYGFAGAEAQHAMWDAFAATRGLAIATLPTGQGLLVKS